MENQKRLKRAEDIHFAEVGDEFYLTLENRQLVACINQPAFVLLENLDGFAAPDGVASALAERYGAAAEEVQRAVAAVCEEAERLGIIEAVRGDSGSKRGPFAVEGIDRWDLPKILRVWQGDELEGGMFVNSDGCDIHVIVPNVTDGPIKTCPPHTCTIPAGLFTPETIIRTFDSQWRRNFERFRRSGIVHFSQRNPPKGER
ncbi:PqqD family protein [Saccharopolyspora hattusasensis]|uniref:PqqD family protein n=1 Tax=Saccharopolyspora hattusasensis TaxID=1128679 RepID=UPI003D97C41A